MTMTPLTHDELRALSKALHHELAAADRAALVAEEAERVRRRNRIPRVPAGCDAQGRHPHAAEACTELGADADRAPRNDVSLLRAWREYLLPPGVQPRAVARGIGIIFWATIAVLLIWAAVIRGLVS